MRLGDVNNLDGRPAYEIYCLQPNTRICKIMKLIDKGLTDEEIVQAYEMEIETAAVYRKVHDGTTTEIADHKPFRWDGNIEMVRMYYMLGKSAQEIADILDADVSTVRKKIRKIRRR